ncbi:hypothetical protein [Enterococcus faecium]
MRKTIFISGSAVDYTPFTSESKGLKFVKYRVLCTKISFF